MITQQDLRYRASYTHTSHIHTATQHILACSTHTHTLYFDEICKYVSVIALSPHFVMFGVMSHNKIKKQKKSLFRFI